MINIVTVTAMFGDQEVQDDGTVSVETAKTVTLVAGQHIDVGTVEIWNDGTTLHVTYSTEDGWVLTETHLYVGQNAPPTNAPGQFPYDGSDAVSFTDTEVTFEILLADIDSYSMKVNKKGKIVGPMSADDEPGVDPGETIYVAAHSVVQKTTVITPAPYYATVVTSYDQGQRKDGSDVLANRSTPESGLTQGGEFFSLGFGGEIIVLFDCPILNGDGNDVKIYEVTGGTYPLETAEVWASQDGISWTLIGIADNVGTDEFDLGSLPWASYIKIVDTSDSSLFASNADGFDLDGVYSLQDCVEINEETAWGGWGDPWDNIIDFGEPNWSNYIKYFVMTCDD